MLWQTFLEFLIKLILYIMFLSGIWLLVRPYLKTPVVYLLKGMRYNSALQFIKHGLFPDILQELWIYHHCNLLLQSTWKFYKKSSVSNFFILSSALFLSTLTVCYQLTKSLAVTLLASVFAALLPYIFLRAALHFIRTTTSYQLGPAVSLLLAGYRVCSKNPYFALLHTINKLENTTLKMAFITLANDIQNHRTRKDIEFAIELFVFKIQTSWAKQLGILLLNALADGSDIEQSLSNIVDDMKEGQKIIEQERSNGHETVLLGYLPLVAFPLSVIFMSKMSGQFNILHHQFKTAQGLTSFLLTSILCVAGFLITLFLRKPKNDL